MQFTHDHRARPMLRWRFIACLAVAASAALCLALATAAQARLSKSEFPYRTIVTSDAEIDDVASFHRLLLHTNELADSLEAIIYSSSTFHWAGDPDANPPIPPQSWAGTQVFQDIINGTGEKWGAGGGYAAIVDNLRLHDPRYPSVEHLNSLIKVGNISYRGEMQKDTEGSDFIKEALLDNDPRPVYLQAWGGTNTVAAALRSIEDEYKGTRRWRSVYKRVTSKARIYVILDQDETYKDYIDPHWPDIEVVMNRDQFWTVAYFRYRYSGERGAPRVPDEIENAYFKPPFIDKLRVGPLLSSYPVSADAYAVGATIYPNTNEFLSEGDSPSYFELLDNGLRSWEDPTYGGWGGRFAKYNESRWSDWPTYLADDNWPYSERRYNLDDPTRVRDASPYEESYDVAYSQARFIPALQNELAARSEWQTKSYADANHPPEVEVAGKLNVNVSPGQRVDLRGRVSDPDGDKLVTKWWHYGEAGTYPDVVDIARPSSPRTSFVVPRDAKLGQTIHMILEVKDRAARPMTRYARIIATIGRGNA